MLGISISSSIGAVNSALAPAMLWTPKNIDSSLYLNSTYLDSIIANGSNDVSRWVDQSGANQDIIMDTPSQKPKTALRTINGLNVISFDGDDDSLRKGGYSVDGSGNLNIFLFCKPISNSNSFSSLLSSIGGNSFQLDASTENDFNGSITSTGIGATSPLNLSGGAYTTPTLFNINFDFNSNILNVYTNGTKVTTDSAYTTKLSTSQDFRLGVNRGNNGFVENDTGLVLCLDYKPTLEVRQKIEGYACHLFGTESTLPIGHPYKNKAPTL